MSYLRKIGKAAVARLGGLGLNSMFRALHNGLLTLCYHSVVPDAASDPCGFGNTVTVSQFREQMAIVAREFNPISADDLRDCWNGRKSLPAHAVLVTFDDGYRNNLTFAAPVLKRFDIPALIFVATGYMGSKRLLWPYEVHQRVLRWKGATLPLPSQAGEIAMPSTLPGRLALAREMREVCKGKQHHELEEYLGALRMLAGEASGEDEEWGFLDWDDLRELKKIGFSIGSHTVEHPMLTRVSTPRLTRELEDSKAAIEAEIKEPCRYFAHPNGTAEEIDHRIVAATAKAGYEFAFTTIPGASLPGRDPLTLNRVVIPTSPSRAEFCARISLFHTSIRNWMVRTA